MNTLSPRDYRIEAGRLARAIHLDAVPIDIDSYMVSGGSQNHVVDVVNGELRCDCMDATVRGRGCKHELCVRLNAADGEVVRALRQLIPAPRKAKARERVAV